MTAAFVEKEARVNTHNRRLVHVQRGSDPPAWDSFLLPWGANTSPGGRGESGRD
jgi:hypothetical protein